MDKKKILIIDDDPGIKKSLKEKLEEGGFIVLLAENAPKGLEEAINNHPDLILLDIVMPTVDGMTLLRTLREDDWGKNAKVILLTNLREDKRVAEALELGSFDYLVKADWSLLGIVEMIKEKLKD
jgi:DNA-binding response OmpR family regulator